MTDNRTTELESLSKLKLAGRLRYWRGTIEIPETELHAICDEIQTEHDQAIAATLGSEREKQLEKLVSDLWQGHECGAGCAMYEECRHPLDDRCPMEERVAELGSGTCENLSGMNVDGVAGYHFICSECGLSVCASMGIGEIEPSGPRSFGWKVDGRYEFERCPRCGKAVKR